MTKRKVFMLVWDVDVDKGGINSVMFRRTHLFNNDLYTSDIITLDDKPYGYADIEATLHADGRLCKSSHIINVYDYYRKKMTRDKKVSDEDREHYEQLHKREEKGYKIQDKPHATKYFLNGQFVKHKKWDADGKLASIDYYHLTTRVIAYTEEYHPAGYLIRKSTYHPKNGGLNQILHYTADGHCYLARWFNSGTGKQQRVVLFSPDTKQAIGFENNNEFHQYFLEELARQQTDKPYMICDGPGSAYKLQQLDASLAHRIYAIHTTVYEAPYTRGSVIKDNHKRLFDNDAPHVPVVVLTEHQKKDLEADFGDNFEYYVISHAMNVREQMIKKQPYTASIVSRLADEKRVDLAIRAFKYVVRDEPEAVLNIYGTGEQEAALRKLIRKLKLTKHVFLKGYTTEADRVFAESQFTIITSRYEGQSLIALEAYANKTAVVSFDINYLVEEMYDNPAMASIVPDGDVEALADAMIELMKDPARAKAMGEVGYDVVKQHYSFESQYEKWHALFQQLDEK
ncbi:glycosyltransferase [Kurthia massiliensis]|uniref:glycosyltransferase n=1 Tax=Kurthia massiliensis TaxID=1033739 RepID=UPI0002881A97|nr:glycosyltransferase [Kurthia massiliensis]